MTQPASIRHARTDDAGAVSALIQEYVPVGTLLPRAPEFIAERTIDFLVATVRSQVIGCVHLEEYSPSMAELRSLVVDPAYQGQGVGIALVAAVEELAARRDYPTIFAVSNNEAFFRARGYAPRSIPELDRERSAVSRFKGVFAKDLVRPASPTSTPGATATATATSRAKRERSSG
jgi:N-acetylglutamate synthase-like GNAT family acetyltransferase